MYSLSPEISSNSKWTVAALEIILLMMAFGGNSSSPGFSETPSVFPTGGPRGLARVSCLNAWMTEAEKKDKDGHK